MRILSPLTLLCADLLSRSHLSLSLRFVNGRVKNAFQCIECNGEITCLAASQVKMWQRTIIFYNVEARAGKRIQNISKGKEREEQYRERERDTPWLHSFTCENSARFFHFRYYWPPSWLVEWRWLDSSSGVSRWGQPQKVLWPLLILFEGWLLRRVFALVAVEKTEQNYSRYETYSYRARRGGLAWLYVPSHVSNGDAHVA